MTSDKAPTTASEKIDELVATPDLAEALASDRFKQFLDHIPVALLVGEIESSGQERLVYANREAETLLAVAAGELEGGGWDALDRRLEAEKLPVSATLSGEDTTFRARIVGGEGRRVEVNSALVTDSDDKPRFRIVALLDASGWDQPERQSFEAQLREKDILLREIQHRVKNNLQIITALVRMEARRAGEQIGHGVFERLAGRIEALGLLYRQLEFDDGSGAVDLGALLGQIASAVVRAQAVDGVKLDLQVEPCMTGIDVAMPVGLMVNELLTNSMKYAFEGREGGVATVRCLKEGDDRCMVCVGDDGVGMAPDATWPQPGKLGALMVRSLEDNTSAKIETHSAPGKGVTTRIVFRLTPSSRKAP